MINENVKAESLNRLNKIEGQVRGIAKMVENEKYCIEICILDCCNFMTIAGVAKIIMKRHVESCVTQAILEGHGKDKIDELVTAVFKHGVRR